MPKQRLDQLLVERGLAETRAAAQRMVMAGLVYSGERRLDKAGLGIGADTMRFDLAVAGMKFDGSLEILVEELLVKLDLPGAALLFKGRIREGIEERLGGLLG